MSPAAPKVAPPSISVVVCSYTSIRWSMLTAALASLGQQTLAPNDVVVVVDHSPELLQRVRGEVGTEVTVVANAHRQGLSGARNTGLLHSRGDVVAFLDDDAVAEPTWLERIAGHYVDPRVLGVGGAAIPDWLVARPRWLPPEFYWVLGCSYTGLPSHAMPVRNFIGANMSFRRGVFAAVGDFSAGIGRVGTRPMGCEETELCIRILQAYPNGMLVYDPAAVVRHKVPKARTSWTYFRSRCFAEGLSKAAVAARVGSYSALSTERTYLMHTLPAGVRAGFRSIPSEGAAAGVGRSLAIIAGAMMTAWGYAWGRVCVGGETVPAEARVDLFRGRHRRRRPGFQGSDVGSVSQAVADRVHRARLGRQAGHTLLAPWRRGKMWRRVVGCPTVSGPSLVWEKADTGLAGSTVSAADVVLCESGSIRIVEV